MERKQIMEMQAGRKIDAMIAERVMGWTRHDGRPVTTDNRTIGGVLFCPPGMPWDSGSLNAVPQYSTDIACAWKVFEAVDCFQKSAGHSEGECFCSLLCGGPHPTVAFAETAPLAICRAALLAVIKPASETPAA